MKKKSLLWISALLLMLAGCSSDDDNIVVNPTLIVGEWMASHQSKNPNYGDTADMWEFTFNADGTGSGFYGTRSFKYEIEGNQITLHLTNNIDFIYGQTVFKYNIVNFSKDNMEWDEIPNNESDNSHYLKFSRSTMPFSL